MDYCASPKVLLLGISYPDVRGHMAKHNYAHDILQHSEPSVDQAVECVRRKILTEMDGRDLARVVATEQAGGGHEVFTVSKELGGIYRKDRHVYASFNNSRGMRKAMAKAFGPVRFQQVILDYYWMPTGWLVTRWAKTLFQETLPDLVKHNLLAYPGSRTRSPKKATHRGSRRNASVTTTITEPELEEGVVFLPFCAHVCKELVGGIDKLKPYFAITFVKKSELPGHALWKGTMAIDGNVMQHRLGKRLDQEEIYCTFQPKDIYESMEDAHVNKDEVMQMLLSIEDFESIRMIRLRPLRQHEPPSLFRKVAVEPETGGFIGLNWEKGRQRFKEYRRRGKNKPLPPPPPPPPSSSTRGKPKTKTKRGKASAKHDPGSDVETVASDTEDTYSIVDTYSDSSSDEDEDEEDAPSSSPEEPLNHPTETGFDPLSNPGAIPPVTHYFPYPALDLTSYMISKDVIEKDKVMAYYDKIWGPKSSRKKNKKQDIAKQDFQRFQKTQRDYLSSNPRRPPKESVVTEEGYKWTMVGSDCANEQQDEQNQKAVVGYERDGWRLSLRGDDPDSHLVPRIIELAKRDNERTASLQLFEMKNPGFKKYSRTWANNGSYMSCYQIPKPSVLMKMDAAEKSMRKKESKIISDDEQIFQQQDTDEDYESDDDMKEETESIGGEADPASSSLLRFAAIAATAPILSDEFRLMCQESKGLYDDVHGEKMVEGLKPKLVSDSLPYDLSSHDNFPRDLFRLLQDAEERILEHIVCWQKRGRSFIIKNQEQFENDVLRRCCNGTTTTLQSFLSTIMSYGFCEIKRGKRKGGYRHNLFQRGKPKRLYQLVREGIDHVPFGSQDDQSVEMADAGQMVVEHKSVVEERNSVSGITSRRLFISNLYQLLKKAKHIGFDNVIYWETSGKSFKVHKLDERFCTRILPNYFSMTCYRNFKRELIDHGFKCKEGEKYGVFEHPNFVRDERIESGSFERIKLKRKRHIDPVTKPTPEPEVASPLKDTNKEPKLKRRKFNIEQKRANDSKSTTTRNEKSEKRTKTELEAPNEKLGENRKKYKLRRNIPEVIYEILEDSIEEGFSESIRWLPKGDGLFINEPSSFETNFLHKYTEMKRFSTFEAHLERVGFEKSAGPKCGSLFKHQHFVRGQQEKLPLVTKAKDHSASKSRNAYNVRPSRNSTSAAKGISTAIKSPEIDSGNDTETKSKGQDSLDSTRMKSSSPETLLTSSEKENSDLRLASNSVSISSVNSTRRVKNSPATNGLPAQPTERELFPLSAVNSRKTNESTKQPHNILATTADKNGDLSPKCKARSQKRTPRSKKGETPPEVARNGVGRKPTGRRTKSIAAGKLQTPVSRRTFRSEDSDSRDSSTHERNLSPKSGRGLRSSSKVCGKSVNTMNSMTTGSLSSRHLSKCNLEDKDLNPRPLPWKGMRDELMLRFPPPTTPDFPVDRGSDRQIMANQATRIEVSGIVYLPAEDNRRSTQTLSGVRGQAGSIVVSPPPEDDALQSVSDTFEGKFGLSLGGFTALLAFFSSLYGKPRSDALQEIFFWQAGFPQPCQDQIKLLAEWIFPGSNTSSSVMMCLLVEVCSYELAVHHGDDWHDYCVTIIKALGANSPPMFSVRDEVREICNSNYAELVRLEQRMMSAARNHDLRHKLRRAQRSEETMEEASKHHISQRQENYGSRHSHIGIGTSNESLINYLRGYNYKSHVNDREKSHERTPTTGNSIYYSSRNNNTNGNHQHHHNHISTTPTMQQLCMQHQQQHPFGELICQGKSEFIQQPPMGY